LDTDPVSEIKINNLKETTKCFQPPQELFNSPNRISSFSLIYPLKGRQTTLNLFHMKDCYIIRVHVQSPYIKKQLGLYGLI